MPTWTLDWKQGPVTIEVPERNVRQAIEAPSLPTLRFAGPAQELSPPFRRPFGGADNRQRFFLDDEFIERFDGGIGGRFIANVDVRVTLFAPAAAVARKRDVFIARAELAEQPQQVIFGGFSRVAGDK